MLLRNTLDRAALRLTRLLVAGGWAAIALAGCAPSTDDLIDDLSGSQDQRDAAAQELLLAKEKAVEPLLEAFADPARASARGELVDVLVSLMMRVDDERIGETLEAAIRDTDDPALKAHIVRLAGMHRRSQLLDAVLLCLGDDDPQVRLEALIAAGSFDSRIDDEQEAVLDSMARQMIHDSDLEVRQEARMRVARQVDAVLDAARQATLEARVDEADSLFAAALRIDPTNQRAHYRRGRFYYDNGEKIRGLDTLKAHGLLLDVPWLPEEPDLDGQLDDEVWRHAARADRAYQFSFVHTAALPAEHASHFYVGRTRKSLWIGFRGEDELPQDLVANIGPEDQAAADDYRGGPVADASIWRDDIIELFIDTNFDHSSYAHIGINTRGVRVDDWIKGSQQQIVRSGGSIDDWNDSAWRASDALATHVGDDHWSIEYRLDFDDGNIPAPPAGAVWGFNLIRVFRGEEYNQWVRTYSGGHSPDDFGVLRFR